MHAGLLSRTDNLEGNILEEGILHQHIKLIEQSLQSQQVGGKIMSKGHCVIALDTKS